MSERASEPDGTVRPASAVVAVVASPGRSRELGPLVGALGRLATVRSLARAGQPDLVVATDPEAAGRAPAEVPLAVLAGPDDELRADALRLVGSATAEVPADAIVVPLPGSSIDTDRWPSLGPFTRRRWRDRLGLPTDLAVDAATVAPEDLTTALALAATVMAGRAELPLALTLGAVVRTDIAIAASVGARPGVHVLPDVSGEQDVPGRDAASDARLSRAARRLAEERLDPARAATRLLARVGLLADPTGPATRAAAALTLLGTPAASPVRARVAAALIPSPPGG